MGHHEQFVKRRVEPRVLVDFLHAFLDRVDRGDAFSLRIGDEDCAFPADLLERSNIDLEYERDPDKTELEITVEWRRDEERAAASDDEVDEEDDEGDEEE